MFASDNNSCVCTSYTCVHLWICLSSEDAVCHIAFLVLFIDDAFVLMLYFEDVVRQKTKLKKAQKKTKYDKLSANAAVAVVIL